MSLLSSWITSNNTVSSAVQKFWTTSDISQFSSFAAVFDQYRIDFVECWLFPRNPTSNSGAGVYRGNLYTVIDYDDAGGLSSIPNALAYENCAITPATCGIYRRFVPHIAVATYSGSFASYLNTQNQWIDSVSTGVQYYGLKAIMDASDAAADDITYDLYSRVHYSFRNVR